MAFLSRAAELSVEEGQRAQRLLAAAEAALTAGQPVRAGALLDEATPQLGDPLARAQARRLHGTYCFALGHAGRWHRSCWRRRGCSRLPMWAVPATRCSRRSQRRSTPVVDKPGGLVGDSGRSASDGRRREVGGVFGRPAAGRLRRPGGLRLPGERAAVSPGRRDARRQGSQPGSRTWACSGSASSSRRTCGMTRPSTHWPFAGSSSPATMGR